MYQESGFRLASRNTVGFQKFLSISKRASEGLVSVLVYSKAHGLSKEDGNVSGPALGSEGLLWHLT